jgi:hypothetical protein
MFHPLLRVVAGLLLVAAAVSAQPGDARPALPKITYGLHGDATPASAPASQPPIRSETDDLPDEPDTASEADQQPETPANGISRAGRTRIGLSRTGFSDIACGRRGFTRNGLSAVSGREGVTRVGRTRNGVTRIGYTDEFLIAPMPTAAAGPE